MRAETPEFAVDIASFVDSYDVELGSDVDKEAIYLSEAAPNVIEWVTGVNFWNVPSTYGYWRQYQILRDLFMVRCPTCNSQAPAAVDCWGKTRMELEGEALLTWNAEYQDFVCPKCKTTQYEFLDDGMFPNNYNEAIIIAGMRSGKSYTGGHVGGYVEHMCIHWGVKHGKGYLQQMLHQEKSEWFELTFAASTATQARDTVYAKYREMRNNSPWINRYVTWVKEQERQQVSQGRDKWSYKTNDDIIRDGYLQMRFNRIASDSAGVAGRTRILSSIDEWARLVNSEGTRSAVELYRVLNQSLKTVRAAVTTHRLPAFLGLMCNVTSPISQDDPAMITYNMAAKGDLKRTYFWKGATWEFNPFIPRSEFDEEYARDAVAAERDFGANPPEAATPYIDDPIRFWNSAIDWNRSPLVDYQTYYITDPTGMQYVAARAVECKVDPINSYMIFADAGKSWDAFALAIGRSVWVPLEGDLTENEDESEHSVEEKQQLIVQPGVQGGRIEPAAGFQSIDASGGFYVGDATSMEQIHVNRMMEAREHATMSRGRAAAGYVGSHYGEALMTEVVSVLRIIPSQTREVWFDSLVDIINFLRQKIKIVAFGTDNWNSVSSIQAIREMGIVAKSVTLNAEDFASFRSLTYNGKVSMLPPPEDDALTLDPTGHLIMGVPQPQMSGEGVSLVEIMKLSRSEDLKKVFNANKGAVRGQDSDDLARCVVGLNHLVQTSIVDPEAKNKKQQQALLRLRASESHSMGGRIFRGSREW